VSRGPWKRDASGRPVAQALPEEALADFEGTPKIEGCPNPLTLPTSISHAASGKPQSCAPDAFNTSRIVRRMEADGYPFARIDSIRVTDQSSADAWGEKDRQKRQENMRGGKKLTSPSAGSNIPAGSPTALTDED
jgi:hypothetical protein